MKSSLRKGLIAAISAVLMILVAIIIATNVNFVKADTIAIPDDANAPRVSGEWTDDFYVKDGASVRLETEGLKFTTVISKAYLQELTKNGATVEFFATAKKAGGNAQAVTFKYQPQVATMADTVNLNTYLNFNNLADEDMAVACATDFIIETYAKITNGSDVSYVRAYKPENNDIARSMQAVANAHYLASGNANLKAYFTEGNRFSDVTGFVTLEEGAANGSGKLTMPVAAIEGATANIYIGSKKYVGTVANGEIAISGYDLINPATGEALTSQSTVDASIFVDNTVYSTKLIAADLAITSANVVKLLETTGGYIAIAEDINMATAYTANGGVWESSGAFAGMINGFNHTISNFNTTTGLWTTTSAWVNDLAIIDATASGAIGVLGKSYDRNAHTLKIDNLMVTYKTANNVWLAGGLYSQINLSSEKASITNSFIYMPTTSNAGCGLIAMSVASGGLNLEGSYFVGFNKMLNHTHYATWVPNYTGNYTVLADGGELLNIYKNINGSKLMADAVEVALEKDVAFIDSSNVADILTTTKKNIVITEDIDMSTAYTENDGVWVSTIDFNNGTIDGMGHTISNFNTTSGLFKRMSGTIKNLAIANANISGNIGIICTTAGLTPGITLENVFLSVASQNNPYYGATIAGQAGAVTLNVTDSVIYNPSFNCAFGWCNASLQINIDNDSLIITGRKTVTRACASGCDGSKHYSNTEYQYYDSLNSFKADVANVNASGLSDFMLDTIKDQFGVAFISSKNVAKLLNSKVDTTIVITEDIDMATAYTANDGVWTSEADFFGTIIGNNHVIKNLKTNTGLFKNYYGGTMKDLAFTNVTLTGGNAVFGGYADRNVGRAYVLDNIYVHVASSSNAKFGLMGVANLINPLSMTNSVMVADSGDFGIFTKVASQKLTITNSYFINAKEYLDSHYNDGVRTPEEVDALVLAAGNTAYSYASVEAMLDAYDGEALSEFIEKLIGFETVSEVSNYSIVIPESQSQTYSQAYKAAELVQRFF